MEKQNPISRAALFIKKNPTARIILLIVILFVATYGSVEILRVGLRTESPLMVVSSESMVPTLNVGDIILVRGINPSEVTTGTIIIFHSPNSYDMAIVHRVIQVENEGNSIYFRTKGDNNGGPDGWRVPAANLMGVYVGKVPYIGILSLQLRGPLGATIIVILVAVIILIEYNESKDATKRASK
jgi:signal peptidase